jgi:hypothetical protein
VGRKDFVVPVRANEEQVANIGMRDQMLQELQARRILPLEIVEE